MGKKLLAAAAILLCAAAFIPFACNEAGRTVQGVVVDGRPAGGMSRGELIAWMEETNKKLAVRSITAKHGPLSEHWTFANLGVRVDTAAETARILAIGHSGDMLLDWLTQWRVLLFGEAVDLPLTYDEDGLADRIRGLVDRYNTPPEEVRPHISETGWVSFPEEILYFDIDGEELRARAEAAILSGSGGTAAIPVREEKFSDFKAWERRQVDFVLSAYTTYFTADPNRGGNIERAARSIDGRIVRPGEEFSFNRATGLRTRANGYLEAPVYFNGRLVPDAGGGVCQVSTTLFNAVLLAGLAVTERTCHFSPVAYVPIGQDATVADNYLDFRFVNNLSSLIYICTVYEPEAITVYILGNWADKPEKAEMVEMEKKELPFRTVWQTDPAQGEDVCIEEGHKGYDVTVTRHLTWPDGTERTDTFRSVYDPVDTVMTYRDGAQMEKDKKAAEEAAAREEKARMEKEEKARADKARAEREKKVKGERRQEGQAPGDRAAENTSIRERIRGKGQG